MKRRSLLRAAAVGRLVAGAAVGAIGALSGCAPDVLPEGLFSTDLPSDRAAVFQALGRGAAPAGLSGPSSPWASAADEPARVEGTAEGLRLISSPGRRAWVSPRLPVAPLDGIPRGQIEDLTWEASITVQRRFFIVCELRFAGEPGALLIQATPFDLQVFQDADRPAGGTSESVSRLVGNGSTHFWRVRVAGGRLDLRLDGTTIWSLEGPQALARVAFGETRTDDEHGGMMLLRDVVYVRRPVA